MKFIDLGLPSGTKWANMNIGAEKETDYGLYFQWGATKGYAYDSDGAKTNSYWPTFPGNGGSSSYEKTAYAEWKTASLTNGVLNNDVDAVYQATNGNAKMPTCEQQLELLKETNVYLVLKDDTEVHGTWNNDEVAIVWDSAVSTAKFSGCKFVNKSDPSKYIFIPAAGAVSEGNFVRVGINGYLWSGSVYTLYKEYTYNLYFHSGDAGVCYDAPCYGLPVRGVLNDTEN